MNIGIVYGYGLTKSGELDAQTAGRCQAGAKLYRAGRIHRICITVGVQRNGVAMGDKMVACLVQSGVPERKINFLPHGFNTAGETDACLAMIEKRDNITAISSWYHLFRIWLLWLTRGRIVRLVGSYAGVHKKDLVIEPVKLVNSVLRQSNLFSAC